MKTRKSLIGTLRGAHDSLTGIVDIAMAESLCKKEETCEYFAIMDREIVWYGSMNLLGKSTIEDSMMRVLSRKIAAELMELIFVGKE